jgi:hypothetical protein
VTTSGGEQEQMAFQQLARRGVIGRFDGGKISSDAGGSGLRGQSSVSLRGSSGSGLSVSTIWNGDIDRRRAVDDVGQTLGTQYQLFLIF